jgi:hypothetical protein
MVSVRAMWATATSHLPDWHLNSLPPCAAGAPLPDDYFFCDALYGVCFRMVPVPASYVKAKEDCARQGGYLPIYNETAKQVRAWQPGARAPSQAAALQQLGWPAC